jgi:hypothetical protein
MTSTKRQTKSPERGGSGLLGVPEVSEATGNLATVMKVMGHTDVRTSIRYQHPGFESDVEWPNISSASAASQSSTAWPLALPRCGRKARKHEA